MQVSQMSPYVDFNIKDIEELKEIYTENIDFIRQQLCGINLNSRQQVKDFFEVNYDILLPDLKIATIEAILRTQEENQMAYNDLLGYLFFLKYRATMKNYIDNILKHQIEGRVYLREINGKLCMPCKQPLSTNPEVLDCIIGCSNDVKPQLTKGAQQNGRF